MALTLSYDAHSEIGLVRKNNQDSAYVSPTMLMVADGMGGAAAGDLASTVAVLELRRTDESLTERLAEASAHRLAEAAASDSDDAGADDTIVHADRLVDGSADVLTVLAGALARANDEIAELVADDHDLEGMGSTVCGFILHEGRLALVNIGDSRAYRLRDGVLTRLTRDHSWVQTLVDDGRITEDEALVHPHRNLILRVLNGNPVHAPDLGWTDLAAGDRLLICSDGLCGSVTDAAIAEVVGLPDRADAIAALVELAHEAGGYDNITIVLADAESDGPAGTPAILGAAAGMTVPRTEHTAPLASESDAAAPVAMLSEEARYAPSRRRRPSAIVKVVLGVLLPLLVLGGGAFGWYSYTQTQFYVAPSENFVAVYQGVPDRIAGLSLSHVVQTDSTRITDLPPYHAERVRATIRVAGLDSAQTTLAELREKAAQCVAQREARARATTAPTPSASATPTAPASGAPETPGATPGATAGVSPSVSQTPIISPEEC